MQRTQQSLYGKTIVTTHITMVTTHGTTHSLHGTTHSLHGTTHSLSLRRQPTPLFQETFTPPLVDFHCIVPSEAFILVVLINHHGPGKLHPKVPHQLWLLTYFSLTYLSQECEDWQTDILSYDLVQLDMKVRNHNAHYSNTKNLSQVTSLGICYVTRHLLRHSASVTSLDICYVTRHRFHNLISTIYIILTAILPRFPKIRNVSTISWQERLMSSKAWNLSRTTSSKHGIMTSPYSDHRYSSVQCVVLVLFIL